MTDGGPKVLDRQTYLDDRKELYKYQQTAYDNFEKTLTALAGGFLAFSVGFLGFVSRNQPSGAPIQLRSTALLEAAWGFLCISLVALLLCSFVNARAFTIEIVKLEEALADASALGRTNRWTGISKLLYGVATMCFVAGLILLLIFCGRNFT